MGAAQREGSGRIVSAIVLAAGQAKRFGRCKQLARVAGKPLLAHVLDALRASRIDDVVVVLGAHADEIREQIRFDRERVVFNPDHEQGMSTSIQTGLRAIEQRTDAALIVLADQPFVTPRTIDRLVEEHQRTKASVVIPTYNGFRGNPVLVDQSLFAEMMTIRGDIGCRAIFGDHDITKLPVEDRGVVMDIDTPADLPGETQTHHEDLLETIVELRKRRQPFAIATVVRAERPTSSKPGDKAIIAPDGTLTGWIGGSCAHDIVVRNALEALEQNAPRFLTLSATGADAKRFGVIDVPMQCYSGGVLDVFIEPSLPRPHMVVIGYESIARALVRISKTLQFHVTVVDPLAAQSTAPEADAIVNELDLRTLNLGGETYVVVATHGRYDEDAVEQAAKSDASYVALVASPKRARTILDAVRKRGVDVDRVKAPAGLDIGAEGAEEIALSIVAEIVQRRHTVRATTGVAAVQTAVDPICHMTVSIADARHTAEFEGTRYYFCCAHCRDTFTQSHVA